MISTHKVHDRFQKTWDEYERKDLVKVCKWITENMGLKVKGDCIDVVKNNWSKVCNFIIPYGDN